MSTFDDFKIGDRVLHDGMGKGTVTEIAPSANPTFRDCLCVHVHYDAVRSVGQYDRGWFRTHLTTLQKLEQSP